MAARGIRSRLLASIALMALAVLGIALPIADGVIRSRFAAFELTKADDDADRLQLLLGERMDRLRMHAVDYAEWTAAANYLRGTNPGFVGQNLYADSLRNFEADQVFVLGAAMDPREMRSLSSDVGAELEPMPERLRAGLLADPRVRGIGQREGGRGFVTRIDDRWYLVGVAAVRDPSLPSLPPIGALGFAAALDGARAREFEEMANLPLRLADTAPGAEGSTLDGDDVATVRRLFDTRGEPTGWLDIHHPRPLLEQTRLASWLLLAMSVGVFLVGSVLAWWLIDRRLVSRLERMRGELPALAAGERDALTTASPPDEIDDVAARVNALHGELSRVSTQWRHEATHDPLTGLGNRARLLADLDARLARTSPMALLLLDLDGFRALNDLFGHATGDHVLRLVAARLRTLAADGAQAYRLGGDEFALLLPAPTPADAMALGGDAIAALRTLEPDSMSAGVVGASIGVAWADAGSGRVDEMLQHADVALAQARRRGRDGLALFDATMLRELQASTELARALDRAIAAGDIDAWFQPIVAADDHRVVGFEVLARWWLPGSDWVSPTDFVGLAERNGRAAALDLAVLRRALQAWPGLQAVAPALGLSVNASAQSLLDADYVAGVLRLLDEHGGAASGLTLEVTETAFAENQETLVAPVAALRAGGVRIVLDDFGVGHSSLSRLARLQPHGLKLDGSFVRHRGDGGDRLCRAVIALAHEFGIPVTAEWVETADDADCLRRWHCDTLQGFHFAAPMPLAEAVAWLQARTAG